MWGTLRWPLPLLVFLQSLKNATSSPEQFFNSELFFIFLLWRKNALGTRLVKNGKSWNFAALSNFSSEIPVLNLVSLTHISLQILHKTQAGIFPISGFLVKSLINKNDHNSRTSNNIAMELVPATKRNKRNTTTPKRLTISSCRQTIKSLSFY